MTRGKQVKNPGSLTTGYDCKVFVPRGIFRLVHPELKHLVRNICPVLTVSR